MEPGPLIDNESVPGRGTEERAGRERGKAERWTKASVRGSNNTSEYIQSRTLDNTNREVTDRRNMRVNDMQTQGGLGLMEASLSERR